MLITLDVEDHSVSGEPKRFAEALGPLLTALATRRLRATFFVVGSLAPSWRGELRDLVAQGHDIGLHGHQHRLLRDLGPTGTCDDLKRGREHAQRDTRGSTRRLSGAVLRSHRRDALGTGPHQGGGFRVLVKRPPGVEPAGRARGSAACCVPLGERTRRVPLASVRRRAACRAVTRRGVSAACTIAARPAGRGPTRAARRVSGPTPIPTTSTSASRSHATTGSRGSSRGLLFLRRGLMLRRVLSLAEPAARSLGELTADPEFVARLGSYSF